MIVVHIANLLFCFCVVFPANLTHVDINTLFLIGASLSAGSALLGATFLPGLHQRGETPSVFWRSLWLFPYVLCFNHILMTPVASSPLAEQATCLSSPTGTKVSEGNRSLSSEQHSDMPQRITHTRTHTHVQVNNIFLANFTHIHIYIFYWQAPCLGSII